MSELTRQEAAAVMKRCPFDQKVAWKQQGLHRALHEWKDTRRSDFDRLWEDDEFDWPMAGYQIRTGVNGRYSTSDGYTWEPDISTQYIESEELEGLAVEFVEDWIENIVDAVREYQERTALSAKEFVAYVITENPTYGEHDAAAVLDVEVGTVRGKLGRVRNKIEEAKATAELGETFDEERMRENRDSIQSHSSDVRAIMGADEFPVEDNGIGISLE